MLFRQLDRGMKGTVLHSGLGRTGRHCGALRVHIRRQFLCQWFHWCSCPFLSSTGAQRPARQGERALLPVAAQAPPLAPVETDIMELVSREPALRDYKPVRWLGEGSFGAVIQATVIATGEQVSGQGVWQRQLAS